MFLKSRFVPVMLLLLPMHYQVDLFKWSCTHIIIVNNNMHTMHIHWLINICAVFLSLSFALLTFAFIINISYSLILHVISFSLHPTMWRMPIQFFFGGLSAIPDKIQSLYRYTVSYFIYHSPFTFRTFLISYTMFMHTQTHRHIPLWLDILKLLNLNWIIITSIVG